MSPSPRPRGRIQELDGLRAISVLLVLIAHGSGFAQWFAVPSILKPEVANFAAFGVQVFFVISGFIITRLQIDEIEKTGNFSFLQFYIRRFFRIIPAYWMFLLTILLLAAAGEISLDGRRVTDAVLFISNFKWYLPRENWFCGHSWTLSVEEQYYVTFPLLMWLILRGNRKWILITLILFYSFSVYSGKLGNFDPRINLAFFIQYKYIVCGVVMALLWEKISSSLKGVSIVLPFMLLLFLIFRPVVSSVHLLDSYLVMPVEALILTFFVAWTIQNPGACGFLRSTPLQWLGRCSYSIYLWQQLFTGPAFVYGTIRLSNPLYAMVLFPLCFCFSYYCIERPTQAVGKHLCSLLKPPPKRETPLSENVKLTA